VFRNVTRWRSAATTTEAEADSRGVAACLEDQGQTSGA
jgi:hypothetical protein